MARHPEAESLDRLTFPAAGTGRRAVSSGRSSTTPVGAHRDERGTRGSARHSSADAASRTGQALARIHRQRRGTGTCGRVHPQTIGGGGHRSAVDQQQPSRVSHADCRRFQRADLEQCLSRDSDGFNNAFDERGTGFGYTAPCSMRYRWFHDSPWVRIDHILADPTWTVRACAVGRGRGSDHRLIWALLTRG